MGKEKEVPGSRQVPEWLDPEVVKHSGMLSSGDDIFILHYRQQEETNKVCMTMPKNILSFVIQGLKQIYHDHGKMTVLPMEGFFMQKGNYLRTERCPDIEKGYESLVIFLSDEYLQKLSDELPSVSGGPAQDDRVFHLREDVLVAGLLEQFLQYFRSGLEKERIEAVLPLKLREMLALLISSAGNRHFGSWLRGLPFPKESTLDALMEAHFKEQLSIGQWAFLAGQSLSSFKRRFEAAYRLSPGKWIQRRRLQEAYKLLVDQKMNVTEVCYEVGFENLAHFIQAFKEQYGITPKQRAV